MVSELAEGLPAREAALRLFCFVRDEVLYAFGPWGVSASHTLRARQGTCTNKSNLLVALLRCTGIPAAYGVLHVDARYYFGPIGPGFLTRYASPRSVHIHADLGLMAWSTSCSTSPRAAPPPTSSPWPTTTWPSSAASPPFGSPETLFAAYAEELRRGGDGAAAKRARSLRA